MFLEKLGTTNEKSRHEMRLFAPKKFTFVRWWLRFIISLNVLLFHCALVLSWRDFILFVHIRDFGINIQHIRHRLHRSTFVEYQFDVSIRQPETEDAQHAHSILDFLAILVHILDMVYHRSIELAFLTLYIINIAHLA